MKKNYSSPSSKVIILRSRQKILYGSPLNTNLDTKKLQETEVEESW